MYRFMVGICKRSVELDVPYDTFFPSVMVNAVISLLVATQRRVRGLTRLLGNSRYFLSIWKASHDIGSNRPKWGARKTNALVYLRLGQQMRAFHMNLRLYIVARPHDEPGATNGYRIYDRSWRFKASEKLSPVIGGECCDSLSRILTALCPRSFWADTLFVRSRVSFNRLFYCYMVWLLLLKITSDWPCTICCAVEKAGNLTS